MTNRLAGETSPYLLLHADDPVHWWPWCEGAFEHAASEDMPVLLSIGCVSCAGEDAATLASFQDEAVAAQMNGHFVCILVDRDARPDLEDTYQAAHQLLTRSSAACPLTLFLSPDGTPFFSGTDYPPQAGVARTPFSDLLTQIAAIYSTRRPLIHAQNAALRDALGERAPFSMDWVGHARGGMEEGVLIAGRLPLGMRVSGAAPLCGG